MSIDFIVKASGGYKAVRKVGNRRFVAYGATSSEARANLEAITA